MEQYTLKLSSGTSYRLYLDSTVVSDSDLTTLLNTAGSAYFSFDFNGSSPSSTATLQIVDSNDQIVLSNSGVTVVEGKNYKGTWSNMASTFDSFVELSGKALDESQVSFLMKKIKEPVGTSGIEDSAITNAKLASNSVAGTNLQDGSVTGATNSATLVTGSKIALDTVGTPNLRDSSVTTDKLADSAVTTAKIADTSVTSAKIDFTTLPYYTNVRTADSSISTNESSPTTLNSITITRPGTYLLLEQFTIRQTGDGWVAFFSKFTSNGGTFVPSSDVKPGYATNRTVQNDELMNMNMNALIKVTSSTTINAVLWQSATTSAKVDWRRTLYAIRIG